MKHSLVNKFNIGAVFSRSVAVLLVLAFVITLAMPSAAYAISTPAASIKANGQRTLVVAYGSDVKLTWTSENLSECLVSPGGWDGTQGSKTLSDVKLKQVYKLSCKGALGTATAYSAFTVSPPTFTYLKSVLVNAAKQANTNTSNVKGLTQQIDEAETKKAAGNLAEAKKLLNITILNTNKLADKTRISTEGSLQYATAVNILTSSWFTPETTPDVVPADEVVLAKPLNGGYPAIWANAPMDSIIDPWGMYNRESVSYTAYKVHADYLSGKNTYDMPYWGGSGNPIQWVDNARMMGIPVDTTPTVGSIAIYMGGIWGHAAYVEEVSGDQIYLSQYNARLDGRYSEQWRPSTNLMYIHFGGPETIAARVDVNNGGCMVSAIGRPGDTLEFGAHDSSWGRGFSDTITIPQSGTISMSTGGEPGMISYGRIFDRSGAMLAESSGPIYAKECPIPGIWIDTSHG